MKKEIEELLKQVEKSRPKIKNEPELYDTALNEMNNIVWDEVSDNFPADKLMFTNTSTGGVIRIYENKKLPEDYLEYLKLHEFGHILFGHNRNDIIDIHKSQLKRKCLQNWDAISKHLDLTKEDANLTKIELANKYIIPLTELFLNYAEDFEVNSKLYSKEDWKTYIDLMDYADIIAELKSFPSADEFSKLSKPEQDEYNKKFNNINNWLKQDKDKRSHWSHPLWPEDYNMPMQKSCSEYIDLIFQNIDKFMNFIRQEAQNQQSNQNSQSNSQNQQGQNGQQTNQQNGQSSNQPAQPTNMGGGQGNTGNGLRNQPIDKNNNNSNPLQQALNKVIDDSLKKLSLDDIEKLRHQANRSDTDVSSNNKSISDYDSSNDNSDNSGNTWSGQKGLGFGHSKTKRPDVMPLGDGKELAKYIEREAFSRKVENVHSNIMYYYNRRKYGTVDVVTKETKENIYRPGNIYVVVDCSGSIDEKAIKKMLNVIKSLSKKCGPKSRVIWWDTRLCKDTLLREPQEAICGGGTDIGEGIKYVKDKYLKNSNDKLFIISDYYDSLGKWYKEVEPLKNDVLGICWTNNSIKENTSLDKFIENCNYGSDFNSKEFLKKIKTKIIMVD